MNVPAGRERHHVGPASAHPGRSEPIAGSRRPLASLLLALWLLIAALAWVACGPSIGGGPRAGESSIGSGTGAAASPSPIARAASPAAAQAAGSPSPAARAGASPVAAQSSATGGPTVAAQARIPATAPASAPGQPGSAAAPPIPPGPAGPFSTLPSTPAGQLPPVGQPPAPPPAPGQPAPGQPAPGQPPPAPGQPAIVAPGQTAAPVAPAQPAAPAGQPGGPPASPTAASSNPSGSEPAPPPPPPGTPTPPPVTEPSSTPLPAAPTPGDAPTAVATATNLPTATPTVPGSAPPPDTSGQPGPAASPTPTTVPAERLTQANVLTLPRFGVNGPLDAGSYDKARSLNVQIYAVGVYWYEIEPTRTSPPTYQWTKYDEIFNAVRARGMIPHVILTGNPQWASTGDRKLLNAEGRSALPQVAGELAARYRDTNALWSLYNEPDCRGPTDLPNQSWSANPSTCWGDYGGQYADMLKAVYPQVKAKNPSARVLLGGLAYDNWGADFTEGFLDAVLAGGGGCCFDVLDFHHYAELGEQWTKRVNNPLYVDVAAKLTVLRQKLGNNNVPKPIVISEISKHGAVASDPADQARYLIKAFARSLAAGSSSTIWFNLRDDPDPGYSFGLARQDLADKPAAAAYRLLSGGSFAQAAPDGAEKLSLPNAEAYRFIMRNGSGRLIVGWTDASAGQPLSIRTAAARVETREGPARTINDPDDGQADGWVTLSLTQEPIVVAYTPS